MGDIRQIGKTHGASHTRRPAPRPATRKRHYARGADTLFTGINDPAFLALAASGFAALFGNTHNTFIQSAQDHAERFAQLKAQAYALHRQMESGQAARSKRNMKNLSSLITLAVDALTKAYADRETAMGLRSLQDPERLRTMAVEEGIGSMDFSHIGPDLARCFIADPTRLPELMHQSITERLEDDTRSILSRFTETPDHEGLPAPARPETRLGPPPDHASR